LTEFINFIFSTIDFIIHIDFHLTELIGQYGWQTYFILFLIIFWETGVVIWPFLPGDSLLFTAGSLAALPNTPLEPGSLFLFLTGAAILGDTVNYWTGHYFGSKVVQWDGRFLKKKYFDQTQAFYKKYGARTIILARFVPIVRTFAPFVAGASCMKYRWFLFFNVIGGCFWNFLFISAGYFFGNLPQVKKNFSLTILAIIILSCLPMIIALFRNWRMNFKNSLK